MIFCLAVFRSRTQVLEFIEYMRSYGFDASAVNTPSDAHLGCGISAKIPCGTVTFAKGLISKRSLDSFYGFYSVEQRGIRQTVTRYRV